MIFPSIFTIFWISLHNFAYFFHFWSFLFSFVYNHFWRASVFKINNFSLHIQQFFFFAFLLIFDFFRVLPYFANQFTTLMRFYIISHNIVPFIQFCPSFCKISAFCFQFPKFSAYFSLHFYFYTCFCFLLFSTLFSPIVFKK